MTKTFYPVDGTPLDGPHGSELDFPQITSQTTDPGTGSSVNKTRTVPGASADAFAFGFYTPNGEPNSANWPDGVGNDYIVQIDVFAAGADLTYSLASGQGGHIARVDSTLTSDSQTITDAQSATGSGIKTLSITPGSGFWSGEGTSDRFEALVGVDNANMMDQSLTIRVNTSNTFLQGPWTDAVITRVPRSTPYPQLLAH